MTGQWIGPASLVAKALEIMGAEVTGENQFRIEGPPIQYFMQNAEDDDNYSIVEVSPETVCFRLGEPVPVSQIVGALQYAFRVTIGLPVASKEKL